MNSCLLQTFFGLLKSTEQAPGIFSPTYLKPHIFEIAWSFAGLLQELVIPPAILEWLGYSGLESDRTEQTAGEMISKRLARHWVQAHGEAAGETVLLLRLHWVEQRGLRVAQHSLES
jgi:hypothetical protein